MVIYSHLKRLGKLSQRLTTQTMIKTLISKVGSYVSELKSKIESWFTKDNSTLEEERADAQALDTQLISIRSKVVGRHPELVNSSPGIIVLSALTESWESIDNKPLVIATMLCAKFGSVGKGLLAVHKAKEVKINQTESAHDAYAKDTSVHAFVEELHMLLPARLDNIGFIPHDDPLSEASDMWLAMALRDGSIAQPTIMELADAFGVKREELNKWDPSVNSFCFDNTITRQLLELVFCVARAYTRAELNEVSNVLTDKETTTGMAVLYRLYEMYAWMSSKAK